MVKILGRWFCKHRKCERFYGRKYGAYISVIDICLGCGKVV